MPTLHVCPLARLNETVEAIGASHLVSLINPSTAMVRPASIPAERHLFIGISDMAEPADGHTVAAGGHIVAVNGHIERLIAFVAAWPRVQPLVIHCWAGISRSTAAAFIAACALAPHRAEAEIALALRRASATAAPNRRLVAIADDVLRRQGRMIAAIERMGRGRDALEGEPFMLRLD